MSTPDSGSLFHEPAAPLRPSRGRLTLIFVVVVAVGLVIGRANGPTTSDPGGTPAPEVVLTGFDGVTWRLSDHLADDRRPVVLNAWASWCLPCREEIPDLSTFARDNPAVKVVGVAVDDTRDDAAALIAELAPAYLTGMDATGTLTDRYGIIGMPTTFLIDPDGMIVWSKTGAVTADEVEAAVASLDQEAALNRTASRYAT